MLPLELLIKIGLNPNEAKLYLSLLKLGSQPTSIIAKSSNVNRTTAHLTLNELAQKGLVESHLKNGVQHFKTNKTTSLQKLTNDEKAKAEEKIKLLNEYSHLLDNIAIETNLESKVEFFKGIEGIKSIYEDTLKSKKIYAVNNIGLYPPALKKYIFEEYIPLRVKKHIPIKVLSSKIEYTGNHKSEMRECIFIPKKHKISIEINIYSNKIALISYDKENYSGVIITEEKIHETMLTLFNIVWNYFKNSKQ